MNNVRSNATPDLDQPRKTRGRRWKVALGFALGLALVQHEPISHALAAIGSPLLLGVGTNDASNQDTGLRSSNPDWAFKVTDTSDGDAIFGQSANSRGVVGVGRSVGVQGTSSTGIGVIAQASAGSAVGLYATSAGNAGLFASSDSGSAATFRGAAGRGIFLTPSSTRATTCTTGEIVFYQGTLHLCVATNTYRRVVLQ